MKKILSVLLSVTLVFTAMLAVTQTVSAAGVAWAIQTARNNSGAFNYTGFDWSALGTNLIPDPTVSHFDVGGEYGRYAKFDSGHNPVAINPYYWWDKYNDTEYGFKRYIDDLINGGNISLGSLTQDQNGYYELEPGKNYGKPSGDLTFHVAMRSPLNWNAVKKNGEYASLTDDGTGVLRFSSGGAWRAVPLPEMEADKYYVIKFNMKSVIADKKNGSLELCLRFVNGNTELGANAAAVELGTGPTYGKVDTLSFVVYTGSNTYADPFIKFYCQTETFFDDFGVYEVSEEYATAQSASTKLTDPPTSAANAATAIQVTKTGGGVFDYSEFEWSLLGENLVPDPTVAHFDAGETGDQYGRYAKIDANYNPVDVNPYYWWDKASDPANGFTNYYKDLAEHGKLNLSALPQDTNGYYELEAGKCYGAADKHADQGNKYLVGGVEYDPLFRSPLNWQDRVSPDNSLTADGSGVLSYSGGASGSRRYLPLPAMEAEKYYVIKFEINSNAVNNHNIDFFLYNKSVDEPDAVVEMGNAFSVNTTYTVSFVIYTGSDAYSDPFIRIYLTNCTSYFDNFGMYEVSEEYATAQSAGVKLTDPRSYVLSPDYSVTSSASNNGTLIYDYSSTIPSNTKLGANLVTDPTVSDFDGGEYSADGWWNTKVENYNGDPNQSGSMAANDNLIYTSPKYRGLISEDTANSHTDDGSGAIVLQTGPKTGNTSNRNFYLPLPAMESYSYYLVSMWVNTDAFALAEVAFGLNTSTTPLFAQLNQFDSGWKQIVTVVYTGANSYAKPFIKVMDVKDTELDAYINKTIIIDDIGVYEINDLDYAAACVENNYVIKDTVDITNAEFLKQDVDGNGVVNQFDIEYLRRNELGDIVLSRSVNEDNAVDIKDYVCSKKYLVSLG